MPKPRNSRRKQNQSLRGGGTGPTDLTWATHRTARIPKGFHPSAQGWSAATTLGGEAKSSSTPTGLRQHSTRSIDRCDLQKPPSLQNPPLHALSVPRASVLECGCPQPLFPEPRQVSASNLRSGVLWRFAQQALYLSKQIRGPETPAQCFICQARLDHGEKATEDICIEQPVNRGTHHVCRTIREVEKCAVKRTRTSDMRSTSQVEWAIFGIKNLFQFRQRAIRVRPKEKQRPEGRVCAKGSRAVGEFPIRIELTQDRIPSPVKERFPSRGFVRNPFQEMRNSVRADLTNCHIALAQAHGRFGRFEIMHPLAQSLPFVAWLGRRDRPNQNRCQRQGHCDPQKVKSPLAHAARCLSCPAQARADGGTKDENGMTEVSARLRALAHQCALMSTYERL